MTPSHPSQAPAIMHLSIDIMREIFLRCSLVPCQLPPNLTEPRLVLTHVCSAWREIALDIPKLWTDIIIDLCHPNLSVHGGPIISVWLSRSLPYPISLQVCHSANQPSLFTDLVLPNLHRCRRAYLSISLTELRQLLLLPVGALPDLEMVQIREQAANMMMDSQDAADLINHNRITAFQACPKLRQASFFVIADACIDCRCFNLPWGQLSVLYFEWVNISPKSCFDILRECTLLQECSLSLPPIDNVAIDELTTLLNQPVSLPSLHSLSLALMDHHILVLSALHLPNLRTFRPLGRWRGFQWSPLSLRSFPRLDTLDLSRVPVGDNDLWEFLHPLQWLSKLYLPRMSLFTSATRQRLSFSTLVPSVTTIAFGPISNEELISTLEERLVASRAVGSGISMFTLVSSLHVQPTDPRLVARLEALEAAGVRMEFGNAVNIFLTSD